MDKKSVKSVYKAYNNPGKRLLSALMVLILLCSCAGCGKGGQEPTGDVGLQTDGLQEMTPKEVYMPKTLALEVEPWSYGLVRQIGDDLYYFAAEDDGEEEPSGYRFYRYHVLDGSTEPATKVIAGDKFPQKFDVGEDGSICCARFVQSPSTEMLLMKYNTDGEEIYCVNLAEELDTTMGEIGEAVSVLCDKGDRVCLVCQKKIFLFDGKGRCIDSLDPRDGSQDAQVDYAGRGADGKLYAKLTDNSAAPDSRNILREVDLDNKTFDTLDRNFMYRGPMGAGAEKGILVNSATNTPIAYNYDPATQTREPLFSWKECGYLESENERICSLGATSNGKILAVLMDWSAGKASVLLFSKAVSEKEELVLGTINGDLYPSLQDSVSRFNKDNEKYHITIKDYTDGQEWSQEVKETAWNKMNMELVSGNGPDILDLFFGGDDFDDERRRALAEQGFLEELGPYLERSSVISREDFAGHALDTVTFDGKLVGLPKQFLLSTVIGRSSEVGRNGGWSLEEFMTLAESHPGVQILEYPGKARLLRFCLRYGMDAFVDPETKKCSFDSPEFIRLLEFADRHGSVAAYDGDYSHENYIESVENGKILLSTVSVEDFNSLQFTNEIYGGETCAIGYPTTDGTVAHRISTWYVCGIAANSQHKEGAWAFLESFVTTKNVDSFGIEYLYGFPALKSDLEERLQEKMVQYRVDADGEVLLDENGDPIPVPTDSRNFGSWKFDYHVITEEEAEELLEIIRTARPVPGENGEILAIVNEEVADFFQGSKSAAQVADVIQSRAQLYLNEN